MRFLLISDTHGKLGVINNLAARTQANAVIHAGDFGFHDDASYERLSDREILLLIAHSNLPQSKKDQILTLPQDDRIAAAKEFQLVGEFQSYIDGDESFRVPVYAVWGNHEDKHVIERIFRGDMEVENLHVLHHRQAYRVGPALVYGLGGNFLAGSKLMQRPIAGGGGKVWSTLSQYVDLVRTTDDETGRLGPRLFVSHVSPGKEPFVELVGARTRADFTISGHMGAPTCMVWNSFAIHSVEESVKRLQEGIEAVRAACINASEADAGRVNESLAFIGRLPEGIIDIGRGVKASCWYRGMTHMNLPDAHVGYAVMDVEEDDVKIQTFVGSAEG